MFEEMTQPLVLVLMGVAAAGIGFLAGLWLRGAMIRRRGSTAATSDRAFFKGLQYMLSNEHDQAIEEFTKSVQLNSDTIETYVALGNLYRSRGDIDRAIRIRQSIILRPNIDEQLKLRALFDLGLDYRKGGFLSRALETFQKVAQRQPGDVATLIEMERLHEELRDWEIAYHVRQRIGRLTKEDGAHILAHHLVEMGKAAFAAGDLAKAKSQYNKAISTHKECVDAYLHLGDLYFHKQDYKNAVATWKRVARISPGLSYLAYRRLEGAYAEMKNLRPVEEFLREAAEKSSDVFTQLAQARYLYSQHNVDGALEKVVDALEREPHFWEARRFRGEMLLATGRHDEALQDYEELIGQLDIPYPKFQCSECGLQPTDLHWQCPQCRRWDTIQLLESARVEPAPDDPEQVPETTAPAPTT